MFSEFSEEQNKTNKQHKTKNKKYIVEKIENFSVVKNTYSRCSCSMGIDFVHLSGTLVLTYTGILSSVYIDLVV